MPIISDRTANKIDAALFVKAKQRKTLLQNMSYKLEAMEKLAVLACDELARHDKKSAEKIKRLLEEI
jgi:hypothetical protein